MPIPRHLTAKIIQHLNSHEIIFLLGTRQTGKTTLSKLVADGSSFAAANIFFIDLEDKEYRRLFDEISIQLLKNIFILQGINTNKANLIIFDEIQLLEDPANLLKILHDHFPKQRIIATGSSSLAIKHKFSDSLSGRKKIFQVEPLNFEEFLVFKGEEKLNRIRHLFRSEKRNTAIPLIKAYHARLLALFEEYLIFGGYPEVVLHGSKKEKVEKLDSIATSYIQKDIREFGNISNIDGYNKLLRYLAINIGAQFNLSSAQNNIGLSPPTIKRYIALLQETFIIKELPPYFVNKNKEISKNKKIFFKDNGIRNLQIKNFNDPNLRTDLGPLYENYVFNVIEHHADSLTQNHFYRTQAKTEIDFVVTQEGTIQLIEVKSGRFTKKVKAMNEFTKKYQKKTSVISKTIINYSYAHQDDDYTYIPAYLF